MSDSVAHADEPPARNAVDRRHIEIRALSFDEELVKIDGRVDAQEWAAASLLPELIQIDPRNGGPVSRKTEIRLAYGRKGVYAAFVCFDDQASIRAPFFVRDQYVSSDYALLEIDPGNDDTNGFAFLITPSGAIADAQLNRDVVEDVLWDGVWTANARRSERGWEAEIFVPWATLRFSKAEEYEMGINVARYVNSLGEFEALSRPPLGVPGRVSYFARWTGLREVEPGLSVQLRPFTSGRFVLQRPETSLDSSWRALPNAGFDAKFGLTGSLTMDIAANPDFGQAEVDAAVLNLGPFEVFFPEKRTFFLESKELFDTDFQLFYSRRIGAAPQAGRASLQPRIIDGEPVTPTLSSIDPSTRILGSVRITGKLGKNWSIGALTATTGPTQGEATYANGSVVPVAVDPLSQWSVLRLRRNFDSQSWLGGVVTNALRAGGESQAVTGGVDYAATFRGQFRNRAQVIGTYAGERSGMGASLGGTHTSRRSYVDLSGRTLTPHANFNDMGFMLFADFAEVASSLRTFNAQPIGKVRRLEAGFYGQARTTYGGLVTRKLGTFDFALSTLSQWRISSSVGGHLPELDPYETRGGIPYTVPFHWWSGVDVSSPPQKRVSASLGASYGEQAGQPGPDLRSGLTIRPVDRMQIGLGFELSHSQGRPRWVTTAENGAPIFGRATFWRADLSLRATLGITPRLALSSYNQLLYSTAHHNEFLELTDPSSFAAVDNSLYRGFIDQSLSSLLSNTLMRWEYLPGSFIFLAYTHRSFLNERGNPASFLPSRLFTNVNAPLAQHEDVLFIKLVHLFAL